MTRINVSIPVSKLTDEHLLAEHREIKRLPYFLIKSILAGTVGNIPSEFTLGRGHVKFFLDKQGYVFRRYKEIYNECIKRGFNVMSYENNWNNVKECFMNDYNPSKTETKIVIDRIRDRIMNGKKDFYHYFHNHIDRKEAVRMIVS